MGALEILILLVMAGVPVLMVALVGRAVVRRRRDEKPPPVRPPE